MGPFAEFIDCSRPVVIAAHPDDEVIGVGGWLPVWNRRVHIIHVTQGAPDDPGFARRAGFPDNASYAAARREEVEEALALAGIAPEQIHPLGFRDRATAPYLTAMAERLAVVLRDLRPDVIFTHPYEGGHLDHDSTAFAARHAARVVPGARLLEFCSYHADGDDMQTGCFLPFDGVREYRRRLSPAEQGLKRRMLGCFRSQLPFLHRFPVEQECLRMAPDYDFACPPHPGPLFYELMDPAVSGEQWRRGAREAAAVLK